MKYEYDNSNNDYNNVSRRVKIIYETIINYRYSTVFVFQKIDLTSQFKSI